MSKHGLLWVLGVSVGVCIADGLPWLSMVFGIAGLYTMMAIHNGDA